MRSANATSVPCRTHFPSEVLTNREKLIKTILTLLHSCLVLSTRRKGAISLLFLFLCFLEAALFVERGSSRDEMRRKLASEQKTEVVTSLAPAFFAGYNFEQF